MAPADFRFRLVTLRVGGKRQAKLVLKGLMNRRRIRGLFKAGSEFLVHDQP